VHKEESGAITTGGRKLSKLILWTTLNARQRGHQLPFHKANIALFWRNPRKCPFLGNFWLFEKSEEKKRLRGLPFLSPCTDSRAWTGSPDLSGVLAIFPRSWYS